MQDKWLARFDTVRFLGWLALTSIPAFLVVLFSHDLAKEISSAVAIVLFLPFFLYTYVVVIWHWKARYRGRHSDLWGAVILLETSGWLKLVYFFRHVLPDMQHYGRYRLPAVPPPPDALN